MIGKLKIRIKKEELPYTDSFDFYKSHASKEENPSLLFESRSINLAYGRKSIVIPNSAISISGKNNFFEIKSLTLAGQEVISSFSDRDFPYASDLCIDYSAGKITGRVLKDERVNLTESEYLHRPNTGAIIRTFLRKFPQLQTDEHAGLFGAFAYDFSRNFYNFGSRFSNSPGNDFVLFMPSTIIEFDDVKERAMIKRFYFNDQIDELETGHSKGDSFVLPKKTYEDMSLNEYGKNVSFLVDEIKHGRLMQCVLSRMQGLSLQKHPLASYSQLRKINPSPYSFFFSLGENEYLYGASPEMHIVVRNGQIEIRPIAGTSKRSSNPLEDAELRIGLLNNQKEKREHTMLVDLARNELHDLCDNQSVQVTDMYSLETYPNLYHLVSGVTGRLRKGIDSLDALLTTLPAGTLSGAPKLEAMKLIEQLESSRRQFYGGAIGYLNFNGDCNTGITIRSVHVKEGMSYMRAGAGVVAHSTPEGETKEIQLKSEKAMGVLK